MNGNTTRVIGLENGALLALEHNSATLPSATTTKVLVVVGNTDSRNTLLVQVSRRYYLSTT